VETTILHVSDLHVGAREDPVLERGLAELTALVGPRLVIASGDLTHRGRAAQHEQAAKLLHGLGVPVVAVPGNHDIPGLSPGRFTRPWCEFEDRWQTVEPVHASDELLVVGLNSVRPWRHQSGGVSDSQLQRVRTRLSEAHDGAVRVVVLHHQLIGAPWRSRKRPVARRGHVLAQLVDAGAELIVGGHIHQGAVSERHEFEVAAAESPGVVISIAPGLGQPRPHRRGEARGALVYRVTGETIDVDTHIWRSGEWSVTATRRFYRAGRSRPT
jgi:3',5'-cyclic AMP phosphodiesterase CpdA